MFTSLLALFVFGMVALVAIGVILLLVGTVLSVVLGIAGMLLFKVLPVVLVGWLVWKLVQRSRSHDRISEADRRWLDE